MAGRGVARQDKTTQGTFQMQKTIAEMSINTRLIIERLRKTVIGEVVAYAELSAIIGYPLIEKYHYTTTARRKLLTEKMYFSPIPGIGFKRCSDTEKVASGGTYIAKSRRACRRGATITTAIDDYSALSREDQVRHNSQLSLMLTMRAISTFKKMEAIQSKVQSAHQHLSLAATLAAIRGSQKKQEEKKE